MVYFDIRIILFEDKYRFFHFELYLNIVQNSFDFHNYQMFYSIYP